jgi:hypothetical protein
MKWSLFAAPINTVYNGKQIYLKLAPWIKQDWGEKNQHILTCCNVAMQYETNNEFLKDQETSSGIKNIPWVKHASEKKKAPFH